MRRECAWCDGQAIAMLIDDQEHYGKAVCEKHLQVEDALECELRILRFDVAKGGEAMKPTLC